MKKQIGILFLLVVAVPFVLADTKPVASWPVVTKEMKPWTRWWWMGSAVNPEGLAYNLGEMSKAGLGGVEITPIYGVEGEEAHEIDYLSPCWMQMLSLTEKDAGRGGMSVDMTLGTGWPFGGPEVSLKEAATKAIFQEYTVKGGESLEGNIEVRDEKQKPVAYLGKLMAYNTSGKRVDLTANVSGQGVLRWKAPKGSDWRLIALFVGKTFQQVKRAAPGGQGNVLNHFDREAVGRYFARFDSAFTAAKVPFPHSFFNDSYEVYGADWTPDLLEQFEKLRGYRLQDYFPEFLADGKNDLSVRVISDYRETIGEILKENFTDQWIAWAHRRGVTVRNQSHGSPANLIDLYAAVDIPECESFGITDFDIPGLRKDAIRKENDGDPTTLKYASSAAHITGKKYTSSETFTWLTEHFRTSLSQCKPEIDQMFVSGVNHVYFHGSTYSPKEAPWPGWKFYASVDLSPTNTIWRDAPAFFTYVTRTQSFLQEGVPDNDFLLYLPIYDIWAEQRGNYFLTFAIHGMRDRLPEFYKVVREVRQQGYDLDYISDRYLQTTTVEDGWLRTEGGATYKALILPAVKRLSPATLQRIQTLAEQGATILFSEQYPQDVPGLSDLEQRRAAFNRLMLRFPAVASFGNVAVHPMGKGRIITGNDYAALVNRAGAVRESFKYTFGGEYIRRKDADGYHYFFTLLQHRPVNAWVPLAVDAAEALFFDPMNGAVGRAALRKIDGHTEVYMQLKPGESIILRTYDREAPKSPAWGYYREDGETTALNAGWSLSFVQSAPEVRQEFRLPTLESWTDLPCDTLQSLMGTGRYRLDVDFHPKEDAEYLLCLGDVRESASIRINGEEVATLFAVPFECRIGKYLKPGINTLEIEVTNLPANRIADYDRRKVPWRIFKEINFVSITYEKTHFDTWKPVPSGLLGPVVIKELKPFIP